MGRENELTCSHQPQRNETKIAHQQRGSSASSGRSPAAAGRLGSLPAHPPPPSSLLLLLFPCDLRAGSRPRAFSLFLYAPSTRSPAGLGKPAAAAVPADGWQLPQRAVPSFPGQSPAAAAGRQSGAGGPGQGDLPTTAAPQKKPHQPKTTVKIQPSP